MFLANSLNTKLKRSLSAFDISREQSCKFPYQRPIQNPKVLMIQKESPEFTSEQLSQMTKEDFLKKFTLFRLNQKWSQKTQLNFDIKNKKFIPDCTSQRAKTAKIYIKDLLDPDLFESKIPRWNNITKYDDQTFKTPLKKTVFDVNHGLTDFQVVQLKDKKIELGVDSRYEYITADNFWNGSTKLEKNERTTMEINGLNNAMRNTQKYWNKNGLARMNGEQLPIPDERRKIEETRYYKPYLDPKALTTFNYNKMKQAQEELWILREEIAERIMHDNPGCEKFKEKINSLVAKEMYTVLKDKFNELIGKKKMNKNNKKTNRYHWQDEELIHKMKLLKKMKDLTWYKTGIINNNKSKINNYENNIDPEEEEQFRKEILKPLVTKYLDVLKEEENIHAKNISEYKKNLKMNLIKNKSLKKQPKQNKALSQSKYPIDKNVYELQSKLGNDTNCYNNSSFNSYFCGNTGDTSPFNDNSISTNTASMQREHLFIPAYKNVILSNKVKLKQQRCKSVTQFPQYQKQYKYHHPGIYREFKYDIKQPSELISIENQPSSINHDNITNKQNKENIENKDTKTESYYAWSCCMNSDKNCRGCHKELVGSANIHIDCL